MKKEIFDYIMMLMVFAFVIFILITRIDYHSDLRAFYCENLYVDQFGYNRIAAKEKCK